MQFVTGLLYILLSITSLFLICLVLIQRGKGGGLAGAFGGAGGSSAFGTKAGDVFTRVTMITAAVWIAQAMLLVIISNDRTSAYAKPDKPGAKSEFTPSDKADPKNAGSKDTSIDLDKLAPKGKSVDLDKAGTKGAGVDLSTLPPPPPSSTKPATGVPVPDVSGGSPSTPLPPPTDLPAPPKKP